MNYFKMGDRVMLNAAVSTMIGPVPKGTSGTVQNAHADLASVQFDRSSYIVLVETTALDLIVSDEVALLRAQLAARDDALSAVLRLARKWTDPHDHNISSIVYKRLGAEITALLESKGVR